jgi:predicted nuclease of predicted toxin-antitoxin system
MTLLVDNQLPVALARYLSAHGWDCIHVRDVGLDEASDQVIWAYAKAQSLAIVTKDEDFQALANRQGIPPPQVVWVRLGNCRKHAILEAFSRILPSLKELLAAGDSVVEIR